MITSSIIEDEIRAIWAGADKDCSGEIDAAELIGVSLTRSLRGTLNLFLVAPKIDSVHA